MVTSLVQPGKFAWSSATLSRRRLIQVSFVLIPRCADLTPELGGHGKPKLNASKAPKSPFGHLVTPMRTKAHETTPLTNSVLQRRIESWSDVYAISSARRCRRLPL